MQQPFAYGSSEPPFTGTYKAVIDAFHTVTYNANPNSTPGLSITNNTVPTLSEGIGRTASLSSG